jgi:hypothetical protein
MSGDSIDTFLRQLGKEKGVEFEEQINIVIAKSGSQYSTHCFLPGRSLPDHIPGDVLISCYPVNGVGLSEFATNYEELIFDMGLDYQREPDRLGKENDIVSFFIINQPSDPEGKKTFATLVEMQSYLIKYGNRMGV